MCGFCLLFAWANSYQNLKMYEYALQEGIWQFTDWSTGWGTHRGPRDAAGASLLLPPPAPIRADAYLEVVFTNKGEPVGGVLINDSLGCIDH